MTPTELYAIFALAALVGLLVTLVALRRKTQEAHQLDLELRGSIHRYASELSELTTQYDRLAKANPPCPNCGSRAYYIRKSGIRDCDHCGTKWYNL